MASMAWTGRGATKQWPYGAVAAMVPTNESRQKRRGWVAGGADGWGRGSWPDGVRTGRGASKQVLTGHRKPWHGWAELAGVERPSESWLGTTERAARGSRRAVVVFSEVWWGGRGLVIILIVRAHITVADRQKSAIHVIPSYPIPLNQTQPNCIDVLLTGRRFTLILTARTQCLGNSMVFIVHEYRTKPRIYP